MTPSGHRISCAWIRCIPALPALLCAFTVSAQPTGLSNRLANTTLTFPPQPPVFGFQTTNAFGTNTFASPVCIRTPPGETNRILVLERTGRIQVVTNIGATNPTKSLYINLNAAIAASGEMGLLGLAFHPSFQSNGYFYVHRSVTTNISGTIFTNERLSRFTASPPRAPTASTNTEVVMFQQQDLDNDQKGGDLHFGPDGYLYVSLGDGGLTADALNNTQTIRSGFHSGILRIDVDNRPGSLTPNPPSSNSLLTIYSNTFWIPPDNPWVTNVFIHETNRDVSLSTNVRSEFWAVGLRNPWRFSFDPVTGWLWCADVGESGREEIDIIAKGSNYGWAYRQGNQTATKGSQTNTWYNVSTPAPYATNFIGAPPIQFFSHGNTSSNLNVIIGGVVYRGNNLAQLTGAYIFGDYTTNVGNIWSLRYNGTNVTQLQALCSDPGIVGYGTDPRNGDILMADFSGGAVKRLIYDINIVTGPLLPPTLADAGVFSDLTLLTPQPGLVPYDVNVPGWYDNGVKSHWFSLSNSNLTFTFNSTNNWAFPTGAVWIEHFDLITNHLTQARTRVETRFLVRNSNGAYGITYRWGTNAANADLVGDGGTNDTFVITDPGGILRTQNWYYPSRNECLACHTAPGGLALGFNTAQLNRSRTYNDCPGATGATDNQLRTLNAAGYFSPSIASLNSLPALALATNTTVSLEWRVRSYLAANCSQCHQPTNGATGLWDGRPITATALAGLINGAVVTNFGNASARVIAPGSLTNSMIFQRIGGFTGARMPPLGTTVLDTNDMNLVAAWIGSAALTGYQTFAEWQLAQFGSTNAPNALADADGDGDTVANYLEYLLGFNPNEAASDWKANIRLNGANAQIVFPHLANRGFEVQARPGFGAPGPWLPLDVPGNAPYFPATTFTNVVEDTGGTGTNKSYRVRAFPP